MSKWREMSYNLYPILSQYDRLYWEYEEEIYDIDFVDEDEEEE